MTTKFDAVASIPTKQKPPRPLTAYHLFFQLEREYILQTTPDNGVGSSSSSNNAPKDTRPIGKQIDKDMPFRYRYIHLNEHWYASGSGKRINGGKDVKKRKHRKTHGKISFLDMSKAVSSRWAELEQKDKMTKLYVKKIAARELDIYKKEVKLFKKASTSAATEKIPVLPLPKSNSIGTTSSNDMMMNSVGTSTTSTSTTLSPEPLSSSMYGSGTMPKSSYDIEVKKANSDSQLYANLLPQQSSGSLSSSSSSSMPSSFHPVYKNMDKHNGTMCRRFSHLDAASSSPPVKKMSNSFGYTPYSHAAKRHSFPHPFTRSRSGDKHKSSNVAASDRTRSDQYPSYSYNHSKDLEREIESFMTRMAPHMQDEKVAKITPNDVTVKESVSITADEALDLMKTLSDDDEMISG